MKSLQKQEQIIISILVSVIIVLLVGSVYSRQLIFKKISKCFNIDILYARSIFRLSYFFTLCTFLFMVLYQIKYQQNY